MSQRLEPMKNRGPYLCLALYWQPVTGTQAVFPDPSARNTQATIASFLIPLPWPGYPALFGYLYMVFLPSDEERCPRFRSLTQVNQSSGVERKGMGVILNTVLTLLFYGHQRFIPAPLDHP